MIPDRYNVENFKKVVQEPHRLKNEYNQLRNRLLVGSLTNILYNGENFMKKDWDNLIILDACRPDFFEKWNHFEGKYSRKISLGGTSREFFIRNMKGGEFYDTVYVTGNTSVEYVENSLHNVVKTYASRDNYKPGWFPEVTLEAALEAYEKHPQKRLVIHFMQPHTPYLGDEAEELREKVSREQNVSFHEFRRATEQNTDDIPTIRNLLHAFDKDFISKKELNTVYSENLKIVLTYVEELLDVIDGKSVITSDHSESFRDFNGILGHEGWTLSREMREVPWLEINNSRRETFAEPPTEPVSVEDEVIRENLRDLGYLE
jgi:hypothetical protein